MESRKALLRRVASITDWRRSDRAPFQGECWVETRNTIYRFRNGVCFQVASADPNRKGHGAALVGMQLVGWIHGSEAMSRLSHDWAPGAYALLWRAEQGGTEALAMTSRTTSFATGRSASHLQEAHDRSPPVDSLLLRRAKLSTPPFAPARLPLPSHASSSG